MTVQNRKSEEFASRSCQSPMNHDELERYRFIVESSNDGLWDWDHQTGNIFWNQRAYEQLGLPPEMQITPAFFFSLVHPDDQEWVRQNVKAHLERNEPYEFEARLRHASGEYRCFLTRGSTMRDKQGGLIRTAGTRTDITDRKRVEEELRTSLKELADIKYALDQSTIVAITDRKGDITYVNDAFCRISKYSTEELLGQNHRIINSGYHPHGFFVAMWRQISMGQVWKGEVKNRAKDGSYYWVDTTIVPFLDAAGKPYQYVAIRHDITQRKMAEEALQDSYKEVADIKYAIDQSAIVAMTDRKGDITYVNEAFCRISKYPEAELIGKNHRIINSGYHPHEFFVNMWRHISSGQVWQGEIKNRAKDGSYYWVDTTIVPFLDAAGKPYKYIAIRHDITARKELEAQLEDARETAEMANQKKTQFLASMSHELRTPLNAVIGFSEMLETGMAGKLTDKQMKYAHNISSSGRHLLDLVNEVLDLAKIEAGKATLNVEEINMETFIDEINLLITQLADTKQISLHIERHPKLVRVTADLLRLRQIFLNLLSNAVKYNRNGGSIYVRLGVCESDPQFWYCEVEDTGIGIEPDKLESIFDEFYQVDNSYSRQFEGTGLGLSVTRKLLHLHGGSILAESTLGKGSTFTFLMPLEVAPSPPGESDAL